MRQAGNSPKWEGRDTGVKPEAPRQAASQDRTGEETLDRNGSCRIRTGRSRENAQPGSRGAAQRAGLAGFLANLSHDMRSPLTSLQEFVSIVHEGLAGPLNERQREYLAIAIRNAETLAEMMDNLLVVTQMQQGTYRLHKRKVRLAELLRRESLEIGRKPSGKEAEILVSIPEDLPAVYVDPDRILEALRNLIDNSTKYSGETVAIEIDAMTDRRGEIVIRVRDNGFGMDPTTRRRLFDRSYRGREARNRSPGGLGLGLSIVREILERHGGRITVTSGPDLGTTFRLVLPPFDRRQILREAIRQSWERGAGVARFAAVKVRVGEVTGALNPGPDGAIETVRDVLARSLDPADTLLPELSIEEEICFLHRVGRQETGPSVRRMLRAIEERLRMQSGMYVEWGGAPRWFHAEEFNDPEEMAEQILHQWGRLGEERDAT